MKGFAELRVRRQGIEPVEEVYRITERFPAREVHGSASRLRRAAVSIPSNVAEGHVGELVGEYPNRLPMARASLAEVETRIEIAVRLRSVPTERLKPPHERCTSPAKQLHSLRDALRGKRNAS